MKKMRRKRKTIWGYRLLFMLALVVITFKGLVVYAIDDFSINAKAGLIVETNTGKIIFEKDANKINYPASVTKILTAIIVIENCNLEDSVVVSKTAISNIPGGYITAPLIAGEEMRVEDLLYALMLKSANDAAYVLAEHAGGSVDEFSNMMNEKAKEIGCENSNFVNPNGIHNDEHYTTAYDMYLISDYAMKNEIFVKIVSTNEYTLPATNKYKNKDRVMKNTNQFINPNSSYYNEFVRGIKTGTTTQAGNCLITEVSKEGLNFINVVLGSETSNGKFDETNKMIEYELGNYTLTQIHKKGDIIKSIEVEKGTEDTKYLDLAISDDIIVMNNRETTEDEMFPVIELNDGIIAPISSGQELGTIKYTVEDIEYSAKLLASDNVEKVTYVEMISQNGIVVPTIIVIAIVIIMIIIVKKLRKR